MLGAGSSCGTPRPPSAVSSGLRPPPTANVGLSWWRASLRHIALRATSVTAWCYSKLRSHFLGLWPAVRAKRSHIGPATWVSPQLSGDGQTGLAGTGSDACPEHGASLRAPGCRRASRPAASPGGRRWPLSPLHRQCWAPAGGMWRLGSNRGRPTWPTQLRRWPTQSASRSASSRQRSQRRSNQVSSQPGYGQSHQADQSRVAHTHSLVQVVCSAWKPPVVQQHTTSAPAGTEIEANSSSCTR